MVRTLVLGVTLSGIMRGYIELGNRFCGQETMLDANT